jgi:hypothetical protein
MEENMIRLLTVGIALIALGIGAANAQQREAVLHKVKIPNVNFDVVVATAKPGAPIINLRGQPDPTVVYVADGNLVIGIDDKVAKMFKDISVIGHPTCTFYTGRTGGSSGEPVALYLVPVAEPTARQQDPVNGTQRLARTLTRVELPGAGFDIVIGLTKSPDSSDLVFRSDNEVDEMLAAVVPMLTPSCITQVAPTDGKVDTILAYVVPQEVSLVPPMQ